MLYKCFIDNEWIEASDGARTPVENPATGETWAEVPACNRNEAALALESSARGQKDWQMRPPTERADYIYKIADGIEIARDELAELLAKEQGKTLAEAGFEVTDTIRYMTNSAEAARRLRGTYFPPTTRANRSLSTRSPSGLRLASAPTTTPLHSLAAKPDQHWSRATP